MRACVALAGAVLIGAAPADRSLFAGADPAALVAGGRVWLYPTGSGAALSSWSSRDLRQWHRGPVMLRRADVGWIERGAKRALWAPHMAAANGRYYLYYSVGPQEPLPSRIGVAVCETPAGPCRDSGRSLIDGSDSDRVTARPVACTGAMSPTGSGRFRFEALDPMVFVDPASGQRLLYAGGSNGATLRAFELGADMISIVREVPVAQPPCFTEGPWIHRRGSTYYLSYSSGHWDRSDYSVRYASGPTATGPWTDRGVLLETAPGLIGPGHHSIFRTPAGGWTIAYHRWEGAAGAGPYRSGSRRVAIARLTYGAEGAMRVVR